jgi:Leucine-rich repeat (LRR) protein
VAQQQQQQQQQLGSSLQELSLAYNRSQQNISGLTALASLVALDLTKCGIHSASLTALTHLTSLTRLGLYGGEEEAKAACGVTGLRELQLYNSSSSSSSSDPAPAQANPLQELPSSLSCLKQLSHLNISGCEQMVELPADLGVWLPRLEVLEAKGCQLAAVPASLTALQRLVMSGSTATSLALPAALSGIRALDISNSRGMTSLVGLSDVTALQHLDLSSTLAVEGSLDVLQPLTRLRHLAFTRECYLAAASFTVLGTLTHLTHLTIGPPTIRFGRCMTTGKPFPKDPCLQALATMPPLPHLEQLTLSQGLAYDGLGAAGPWLAQLTALTQLSLRRMYPMRSHKYACAQLQRLPVTLKELDLSVTPFEEPPSCLTRLTALEVLRIGMDGRLMDLTRWRAQAQAQGRASGSGSGSKKGRKRGG